jgi:hypothetical protein
MPDAAYARLDAVWGSSRTDVFAVGTHLGWYDRTDIQHYDGAAWSFVTQATGALMALWGSSGTDVFAVGTTYNNGWPWTSPGIILHNDGTSWSSMQPGTQPALLGVWGSSAANVYAVGSYGTIVHYDGLTWSPVECGVLDGLQAVWGSGPDDIFALGPRVILHYQPETGVELSLNDRHVHPGDQLEIRATALNCGAEILSANLYVLLDPGIGEYWSWPNWTHWPPDLDSTPVSLEPGGRQTFEVFNLTWPDTGDLEMSGIGFWGALVDSGMNAVGEIGHVEFGFGPF